MSDFREALGVELYDANAKIHLPSGGDLSCFHEWEFPLLRIDFDSNYIEGMAKGLNWEHNRTYRFFENINEHLSATRKTALYGEQWPGWELIEILVRVDAPGLLSLKIILKRKGTEELYIAKFIYSGTFSVEWKP